MPHDHDHSSCSHDHSGDLPSTSTASGDKFNLFEVIDRENVVCLNAEGGGERGRVVIKPFDQRESESSFLISDDDDSLILSIPFTKQITLRSITLKTGPGEWTPRKVRIFVNSPGLDFGSVEDAKPEQELDIIQKKECVEYGVRPAKFSSVTSLQLHFPSNWSQGEVEEKTRIYYVGLKGEWKDLPKNPTGVIIYESQPVPGSLSHDPAFNVPGPSASTSQDNDLPASERTGPTGAKDHAGTMIADSSSSGIGSNSNSNGDDEDDGSSNYPAIRKGASFLIAWQLKNRKVLLIGGGLVASGRLYYLLESGAHVTLVSPRSRLHPETAYRLKTSAEDITYVDRDYVGPEEDEIKIENFDMVLTAIDEVGLSRKVCLECRKYRIPVNVADVPPECDFYFGSQFRRGPLQVMVSTSGRGPKIASLIRKQMEDSLPDNIESAIDSVGKLRSELREIAPGTGGELGQKRMKWMIGVCDRWNLNELSAMTPEMRKTLLKEGWEKDQKVLGPRELGVGWNGSCPLGTWIQNKTLMLAMAGGIGAVLGALVPTTILLMRRNR